MFINMFLVSTIQTFLHKLRYDESFYPVVIFKGTLGGDRPNDSLP